MTELLGTKAVTERKRLWSAKRVFYCTPQILDNDLKNGIVDIKRITCVVVDECHRAQGDYAYTTLLKQLRTAHRPFRVLGLSATRNRYGESSKSHSESRYKRNQYSKSR